MERNLEYSFFDYLDKLPRNLLVTTMRQIHVLMQVNRLRLNELSNTEIEFKLKDPIKPGENKELAHEFNNDPNCLGITPEIASELADHAYYRLMENVGSDDCFDMWYKKQSTLEFMGIDSRLVIIFGIIKYSKRVDHGKDPNYKEIEYDELNKYLNLHPNLLTLWKTNGDDEMNKHREIWHPSEEPLISQWRQFHI